MVIKYLDETYLEASISLMSKYNKEKCYQIGYCAKQVESIRRDLVESLKDEENKLIGVLEEGILIGVIDLDVDSRKKTVEMVGPFIEKDEEEEWLAIGKELLSFIFKEFDSDYEYLFFIHQENKIGAKLLDRIEAQLRGYEYVLNIERDCMKIGDIDRVEIKPVDVDQYEEVMRLHDATWPGVYYSGQELIEQLDENHKLFVANNQEEIEGYIFVENEIERGYIHFLAVKETHRRNGIGRKLLNRALEWSFANDQIEKLSLCVEVDNEKALNLYYNVGCKIENVYVAYRLQVKLI